MAGFLLGYKHNQSQAFDDQGRRIPTTVIESSPCYLIDIKTTEKSGYAAAKIGFGIRKTVKKSTQGELKKVGIELPLRNVKEIRISRFADSIKVVEEEGKKGLSIGENKIFVGDVMNPSFLFQKGEFVNVSGISKGKGFQGVMKRHGFAGGPKSHGQSDRERAPGSIGQTTTPGRVYKGKRMAGRMGGDKVTVKRLQVVDVTDKGITIKGLVPGHRKSLLTIISCYK